MSRLCLRGVRDSVSHPLHSSLMDLALGMAWCWINWLKSRKTGHRKEKHGAAETCKMGSWGRAVMTYSVICKVELDLLLGPLRQDVHLGQDRFKQFCHTAPWISRCHSLALQFSALLVSSKSSTSHGKQQSGLEYIESISQRGVRQYCHL